MVIRYREREETQRNSHKTRGNVTGTWARAGALKRVQWREKWLLAKSTYIGPLHTNISHLVHLRDTVQSKRINLYSWGCGHLSILGGISEKQRPFHGQAWTWECVTLIVCLHCPSPSLFHPPTFSHSPKYVFSGPKGENLSSIPCYMILVLLVNAQESPGRAAPWKVFWSHVLNHHSRTVEEEFEADTCTEGGPAMVVTIVVFRGLEILWAHL